MSDTYQQIYARDFQPGEGPHGWIQWKGTQVCIDLHCTCGIMGHIDGEFVYYARCAACGRVYALGQNVRLIELTPKEQADCAEGISNCIREFG